MINLVRFFIIVGMCYETYCRNNLVIPGKLDGAKAYLGLWRFLTYQNFQILILTNVLLFLGQFSNKCKFLKTTWKNFRQKKISDFFDWLNYFPTLLSIYCI